MFTCVSESLRERLLVVGGSLRERFRVRYLRVYANVSVCVRESLREGVNVLLVGVLTTIGRCDEVHVTFIGAGRRRVDYAYLSLENCNAFIYIIYGSSDVTGSSFAVSC
uniref:Uncharacterized protein n=1 Tax=Parascaris univalens TaxID=6257 RepID=A0A914ZZC5_PARUN